MGIAASQARFLAITSRKANCEFESMRIAQQKLSVTRELASASDKYQQAMNATKLVWDSSGDGSQAFDLTYEMMMTPSVMNGYDPYLVTEAKTGQVVLDTAMATAAKAAGISQTGTPRSETGRNAFVRELAKQGYISGSLATTIQTSPYSNAAGMGGEPLDKTAANAVTIGTLTSYFKEAKDDSNNKVYALKLNEIIGTDQLATAKQSGSAYEMAVNGNIVEDSSILTSLTLGDLLEKNYVLLYASEDNGGPDGIKDKILNPVGKFIDKMAAMLGYGSTEHKALNADDESNNALNFAYSKTKADLFSSAQWQSAGKPGSTRNSFDKAVDKANSSNTIVYTQDDKLNKKENCHVAVSLTNIAKSFLTAYAQALGGYNTGFSLNKEASQSNYVTDDPTYYYVLQNEGAVTEKELLITDFYNSLYNNLCSKGWTENERVNDKDYLQQSMKNGHFFIASLNTDGYYYQDAYTKNGYVAEITDEDAIAQAEADYTKEKNKLNYKEQILELDMKNIDTELSSLTTEYDTVKNLISKNVEKVFTMFQS